MKHAHFSIAFLLVFACVAEVLAVPRAAESSGKHYLFAAQDLSSWHIGGSYRRLKRDVEIRGFDHRLTLRRTTFHVGYDLLPWAAVYGLLGNVNPTADTIHGDDSSGVEFGGGMWFNLLDHDLIDNLTLENRIRVQALVQIARGHPDYGIYNLDYTEFHSALTMSIINELDANKQYWPEAVSLFGGPVFNHLNGSDFSTRKSNFGIVLGSDVQLSRRFSFSLMYERYYESNEAFSGSLNVRL